MRTLGPPLLVLGAIAMFLLAPSRASAQFVVDCTGNTPGAYTSIGAVLPLLTNGAVVRITGPCTENVTINGVDNLSIGAAYGQTAALHGNLTLNDVDNVFLYGIDVTNPSGDGIDVNESNDVTVDHCTSNSNASYGLNIFASNVTAQDGSGFNNNGNSGVYASGITNLSLLTFGSPITANGNQGDGIYLQDGVMQAFGNLDLENNTVNPSGPGRGFGIDFWGHARAVLITVFGPIDISGNQAGGVSIHEGSEISIAAPQTPSGSAPTTTIDGNGPVGIAAGFGSQVTIWGGVSITNHTDAGVDLYGQSQAYFDGDNQIIGNGTGFAGAYRTRAGIRVDGNSEAYIRGSLQDSENDGPGILELDNSSVDISGATLTSNLGGSIVCDSSAWLVGDPATLPAPDGRATKCKVPNTFGPRVHAFAHTPTPDTARMREQEARYKKLISSF